MPASILIVEDEMLIACNLEAILNEHGYAVAGIVPDLASAERYFDASVDLALVDLNLRDGCTGPEIGARLSAAGTIVIFVTANPNLLGEGVAGTIGVITKPSEEDVVEAAVTYALGARGGHEAAPPPCLRLFA